VDDWELAAEAVKANVTASAAAALKVAFMVCSVPDDGLYDTTAQAAFQKSSVCGG